MAVTFPATRFVLGAAVVAALAFGVYRIALAIARLIERRSECYDVEKLDDSEIPARRYDRQQKKRR